MGSLREMIEHRAYELFIKRGGVHGYHMEDWMQAEREVLAETGADKKTEVRRPVIPGKAVAAPALKRTSPARQTRNRYGKKR
jgi:hypothetical protein